MKKNKGYTLVEMIIVIAIMAILSGVSFVTIYVIRIGKRNAAIHTFENQISNCLIKTKAISDVGNVNDELCMRIRYNDTDNNYIITLAKHNGTNYTDIPDTTVELTKEVGTIVYTSSDTNQIATDSGDDMIIQFVKSDGSVKYGGGTYRFYSRGSIPPKNQDEGGDDSFATITLDAITGNHTSQ